MAYRQNLLQQICRKKSIDRMIADSDQGEEKGLQKTMTLFYLTMLGVGGTIGTGIFFALAETVPKAGPAVIVSFVVAAFVAGLTALCYAEIASAVPASGSSYSYAYATLGEGMAFFAASCLMLEYGIAVAAVSVGWSEYLNEALKISSNYIGQFFNYDWHWHIPEALSYSPLGIPKHTGIGLAFIGRGYINLPAIFLISICAFLLTRGTTGSAKVNAIMVSLKLGVLMMFIVVAAFSFNASDLMPFNPYGTGGIIAAAGTIFFSYVGLDAVVTAGEEVQNPKRNLPLAIIIALLIVTVVYVSVALSALGAQPTQQFANQQAVLAAILKHATGKNYWSLILSLGAVISVFSVTLVTLFAQTRILFALSRDGMIPAIFHRINPITKTPISGTIMAAGFASLIAAFIPSSILWDLVSVGTLVAFSVIAIAVIILRRSRPDIPRGFKVPFFPYLPIMSILCSFYLIFSIGVHVDYSKPISEMFRPGNLTVFMVFGFWLVLAGSIYIFYSRHHSRLEQDQFS